MNNIKQNSMAVIAALIWGTAFVAQSIGADYIPAFTFNALRGIIAVICLFALSFGLRRYRVSKGRPATSTVSAGALITGGICCGLCLGIAAALQQLGIETTTAGKAGFITALYIVIVPILGIFLGKRVQLTVWGAVVLAVAGLYFLCMTGSLTISMGDIYIILCAFFFSFQILFIDYFVQKVDGIELSCAQFVVMTLFNGIVALLFEHPTIEGILTCIIPLLYLGVFSCCIAYTLQILAQKDSNPTVISLLLSLESVFATISGAIILHDHMSGRELLGCVLMFAAVVLAQLPEKKTHSGEN